MDNQTQQPDYTKALERIDKVKSTLYAKYTDKNSRATIDKILEKKQKEFSVRAGLLKADDPDIVKNYPDIAARLKQEGYELTKTPEKEADIKRKTSFDAAQTLINNLEKQYAEAGGGTYGVGPGARIKGTAESIKGKIGLNEGASVYDTTRKGFTASLKSLTGDTGVLTEPDYQRIAALIPTLGLSENEAKQLFSQLRQMMGAKYGQAETQTTFEPKVKNERGVAASLIDTFLPSTVNLAEKAQKDLQTQLETGNYKTSLDLLFPKSKEDVSLLNDIAPAGIEVGLAAMTAEGITKGAKAFFGKFKNGKEAVAEARRIVADASKETISADDVIKAGEKYVGNDPTAKKLWETTIKPAIQQKGKYSISEMMDQIKVWNDAYTSAGKVGKTALAGLNDALARASKDIIKVKAPEVAKYTKDLADIYGREALFKTFGPAIIGGAGGTLGGIAIGTLFGQKR